MVAVEHGGGRMVDQLVQGGRGVRELGRGDEEIAVEGGGSSAVDDVLGGWG